MASDGTLRAKGSPATPYFGYRDSAATSGGVSEVVTLTEATNITAGTYTLTFGGQTTGAIQWDATAANVQTALIALSTIPAGGVVVTGMAGGLTGAPAIITFAGALAERNVGAITSTQTGLTGTFTIAVATAGIGEFAEIDLAAEAAEGRAAATSSGLEVREVDNAIKVSATQHTMTSTLTG